MSFQDNIPREYDKPSIHVSSEGEKLIKQLVKKQLHNHTSLADELSYRKEFAHASDLLTVTTFTSGENDLAHFQKCTEFINNLEELRSYGLNENEIEFYLDSQKGDDYIFEKHKNMCKMLLKDKLNEIFQKISDAKSCEEQKSSENTSVSRHLRELALRVKPTSQETKLYNFALSCTSNETNASTWKNHPMDQLPTLEKEMFGHLDVPVVPSLKKRRKRARKFLDNCDMILNDNSEKVVTKSKWDLKQCDSEVKTKKTDPEKCYTCKPLVYYTIKDNKIVKLDSHFGTSTEKELCLGKQLREDEIRMIPRFQNYEKGTPTKILYLKNLANGIKEHDLSNILNGTKIQPVSFRLLTGKMKGQAFVTFQNVSEASVAFSLINGLLIKGKPIVIQYGRSEIT